MCEKILRYGYGVAFHPVHKDFRPFRIENDEIHWWHESEEDSVLNELKERIEDS